VKSKNQLQKGEAIAKRKAAEKKKGLPPPLKKRNGIREIQKSTAIRGSYRQKKSGRKEKSLPPPLKPIRKHHKTYDSRQVNGKTKNAMQKVRRSHSIFCSAFRRNAQPLPTQ